MNKNIKILIVLIMILSIFQSFAFADEFYNIERYDISIEVSESNVYNIEETIYVNFKTQRHGIFRDIPVNYYGYSHDISNISVVDPSTNEPYKFEVSNQGANLDIKIGDANTYVSGKKAYQINYTYDGSDDLIKAYDEFYFNILGTEWNTTIDEVNFEISMPKSFDVSRLNITSGAYGSTSSEKVAWDVDNLKIVGFASDLLPYEGITVALNLDEGYFTDVSKPYSLMALYFLIVFLLMSLAGAIYIRNSNYRRNKLTPVLNFYPPQGLNPAEMAYIFNEEKLSNQDVSSIIIYWASKGYLKIIEEEKSGLFKKSELSFEKIVDSNIIESLYERNLFEDLFSKGIGNTVSIENLENQFYADLDAARGFVRDIYRDKKEILENKYQYGIYIVNFLILLITAGIFANYFKILSGVDYLSAFIMSFIFLFIFWIISVALSFRKKKKKNWYKSILKYGVLIFIFSRGFLVIQSVVQSIDLKNIEFNSLTMLMSFSVVLYIASIVVIGKVKRYSEYGRTMLDNIYGFKEFLETAKLDRLEMLYKEQPSYFYDMLPYVMIFDLTKIWDSNIQRLALEGPDWYISNRPFSTYLMMSSMNRSFTQMSSKPQSSSSSFGGGSVGGGGGGGGGGSW
ncbi:MAG: DUF2207 domain-containing protein [Clostridiales bacterium]|nr:DUF2207 domain-containing protein [Clostridiales bacterium]